MRQFMRLFLSVMIGFGPAMARADEACDALGHLLLASDLMRIASDTQMDLDSSYGPSIGASIRSSGEFTREMQQRAPEKVSAIQVLRNAAAAAFTFVMAGQSDRAVLEDAGVELGEGARQLYLDWTCDDPEAGDGQGELEAGVEGERDPGAGSIGRGGAVSFQAVWVALGRDNPVERAVLLGGFATSAILLPYLVLRDRRNRRRAERHVCPCETSIVLDDTRYGVRFFDISVTGARIILKEVLPTGMALSVEVAGQDVEARVARSGPGFAGLEFARPLNAAVLGAQLAEAKDAMAFSNKAAPAPVAKTAA